MKAGSPPRPLAAYLHPGRIVEDVKPGVDGPGHGAALRDVVMEHQACHLDHGLRGGSEGNVTPHGISEHARYVNIRGACTICPAARYVYGMTAFVGTE